MDIELVMDPYACMMYIVSPLAGLGGGILWRPPAYSLLLLLLLLLALMSLTLTKDREHRLGKDIRSIIQ